jgi:hypothetical protein
MPWYDAVNKFIRKDYPGSYKQSAAGPLKSDRILGSMAKAPRGPRGKQVIRKRTAFPKRQPVKRKSTKKRKRLSPRGKFKKPKKLRKLSTKYHTHRYEQEGTCETVQPYMYVKMDDCYKRDAIWDAMADALLRPILSREVNFRPLQDTETIGNSAAGSKRLIVFDVKRVNGTTGEYTLRTGLENDFWLNLLRVDLDEATYEQMRNQMSTILRDFADGEVGNVPSADTVAFFPYRYYMCTDNSTIASSVKTTVASTFEHVGDTLIDLKFSQKIMFRNDTPADGGGTTGAQLDRLGINPLKGKLWSFNHFAPRLLDHMDTTPYMKQMLEIDLGTAGIQKIVSTDANDSHLFHPLEAKYWLKNCVKESNIYLAPGASKSHATSHSIKGKLSSIIERFYFSGFDKGTFGSSTMFMFDMVHKTDQTPSTTYKRSVFVQSAGKLVSPTIFIPDFEAITFNI